MFLKKQKPQNDLKIIMEKGQEFSLLSVPPGSTFFEVKLLIEKAKGYKIDQQHLQLPNNKDLILNDEKPIVHYGLFSAEISVDNPNTLKLTLNSNPILIHLNLSHSLQKYGSFAVNKGSFQIDTSGGSATVANSDELEIKTFPSCSIFCLKYLIDKQASSPIQDQVLTYQGQTLDNSMSLFSYQITEMNLINKVNPNNAQQSRKQSCTGDEKHSSGSDIKEYDINLIIMKKKVVPKLNLNQSQNNYNTNPDLHSSFQVSLGIDFTFNTIKNVKKVNWKEDAPWFREITDGLCWLCYCQNEKCLANKQLVVINKGYGVFSIKREMVGIKCPCCLSSNFLEVRNCGFVNCEWAMRGILNRNKESKIYADGKTYDSKLYTFKECDYKTIWFALDIMVKHLDGKTALKNIPSAREDKKKNNMMIDKALEEEGVPIPKTLLLDKDANKENDEDFSEYNSDEDEEEVKDNNAPALGPQHQIQNIHILPSNRGPKSSFCCADNSQIQVGCSLGGGGIKKTTQVTKDNTTQNQQEQDQDQSSKCVIF